MDFQLNFRILPILRVLGQLEKFQLARLGREWRGCRSPKIINIPVLLVRNSHNTNLPLLGNQALYPLCMHVGTLFAPAVPRVHGVLHHGEAVFQQSLAKSGGIPTLSLRIRR